MSMTLDEKYIELTEEEKQYQLQKLINYKYGISPLEGECLPTDRFTLHRLELGELPEKVVKISKEVYDRVVSEQAGSWNDGNPIPAKKVILKSLEGEVFEDIFETEEYQRIKVEKKEAPLTIVEQHALKEAVEFLTLEALRK